MLFNINWFNRKSGKKLTNFQKFTAKILDILLQLVVIWVAYIIGFLFGCLIVKTVFFFYNI
jgi:hypothetical protein